MCFVGDLEQLPIKALTFAELCLFQMSVWPFQIPAQLLMFLLVGTDERWTELMSSVGS